MTADRSPPIVSFEFFPPADAAMEATLWQSVLRLAPLAPRPLFWWGVGLTVALFALGVAMVSDRKTPDWANERKERK